MTDAFLTSGNFQLFLLLGIIDMILKGLGMWKAVKHGQLYWFIALLIFNTAGILPLLYIRFFQKDKHHAPIRKT